MVGLGKISVGSSPFNIGVNMTTTLLLIFAIDAPMTFYLGALYAVFRWSHG